LQMLRAVNDQVATGSRASIGGGYSNKAGGNHNRIGGGTSNTTTGLNTTIGGGSGNQANLTNAVVAGGGANIASGSVSVIAGGSSNIVNGTASSIAGGAYGHTRTIAGYHAKPFCYSAITAQAGVSQGSELVIGKQTTDATPTILTSDNSGAVNGNNQLALPINSAYIVQGKVISTVTGGTEGKAWTFTAVITKGADNASTRFIGTPTITMIAQDAGASTWAIAVVVDSVNGALQVNFTGQAGKTIRTVVLLDSCETTF
jgi:hypothetical protein